MFLYHNNFFMRVGYLHRLQDRLVDRDYSSTVFHRPYYKMPSNFQHCPLVPHSMRILAVCDTFAWLVGCDISKDVCPAHPSNFSWSPNIHIIIILLTHARICACGRKFNHATGHPLILKLLDC